MIFGVRLIEFWIFPFSLKVIFCADSHLTDRPRGHHGPFIEFVGSFSELVVRSAFARGVYGGSPQNRQVTWLSHKTKTGSSAGGGGIQARQEASMSADTWWDRRACVERTRTAVKVWPCDEEECYMTYLLLRGLYHNLNARRSLSIPQPRGNHIY
jgi:hypothetical protein